MSSSIKRMLMILPLIGCLNLAQASSFSDSQPLPLEVVAETCRQIALKIDWISRHQERHLCSQYLDGEQVYFASKYILANRIEAANQLVDRAIIQTNFAIDVHCFEEADMQSILASLQALKGNLVLLMP